MENTLNSLGVNRFGRLRKSYSPLNSHLFSALILQLELIDLFLFLELHDWQVTFANSSPGPFVTLLEMDCSLIKFV